MHGADGHRSAPPTTSLRRRQPRRSAAVRRSDLADIAVRTGHQFLIDIAHNADAVRSAVASAHGRRRHRSIGRCAGNAGTYDNELLDAHYIAGDGRVNENIGLTAVHAIFHSEHNRLVDQTKATSLADAEQATCALPQSSGC